MPDPPRLLHARFQMAGPVIVDAIVEWLTAHPERFVGTSSFGHAFKLFTDGTSMLGVSADHLHVDWFPAGSFIVEQGEPACELFCILSGSVVVVIESDDGQMSEQRSFSAGCFFGEDGLATGLPRNAHVIARDDVTCLVLAPTQQNDRVAGRGPLAVVERSATSTASTDRADVDDGFSIDVTPALDRKVAALAAHRSQYAMEPGLLPRSLLERLLGTEHFVVASVGNG
jgi:CRP-like cAMP-binding protein